jgi:PiT family inorganic phosphate transporter
VETALLAGTVVLALTFAWTNGFHDTSNAVATSLATGALTPRVALGLAAVLNGVGSLLGVNLALFVSRQLVDAPVNHPGLGLVMAALIAAIGWNLATWAAGMPSSWWPECGSTGGCSALGSDCRCWPRRWPASRGPGC